VTGAATAPESTAGTRGAAPPSTRARILETALRLYSERGTAGVSMRELADAAGVTVQGLYYHFASKADLIQALYSARGFGQPGAVEHAAPGPVARRIVEQARYEFDRLVADVDFMRLMQREAVFGDDDALAVGRRLGDEWRARWRSVLAGSSDLAPAADLAAAADCIATFLWGLFVQYLNDHDESLVARIDTFAALVAPALTAS
jgi:TetR/AcrR family transcriptional regulator, repressor for uid operon